MTANRSRRTWAGLGRFRGWPSIRMAHFADPASLGRNDRAGRRSRRGHVQACGCRTGTIIPAASVQFGMRPYADNTFYIIGIRKGWFRGCQHHNRTAARRAESHRHQRHRAFAERTARLDQRVLSVDAAAVQDHPTAEVYRLYQQLDRRDHPRQPEAEAEVLQGLHEGRQRLQNRRCTMPWRRCRAKRWSARRN